MCTQDPICSQFTQFPSIPCDLAHSVPLSYHIGIAERKQAPIVPGPSCHAERSAVSPGGFVADACGRHVERLAVSPGGFVVGAQELPPMLMSPCTQPAARSGLPSPTRNDLTPMAISPCTQPVAGKERLAPDIKNEILRQLKVCCGSGPPLAATKKSGA